MAPQPENESVRLELLRRYALPAPVPDPELVRIATLAAVKCQVPFACVNFPGSQLHPSRTREASDDWSSMSDSPFCVHTIQQAGVLEVTDARKDPRFDSHPLVKQAPFVCFYAGAPVRTSAGIAIGTVAVMDSVPHLLAPGQGSALMDLADQVFTLLELRLADGRPAAEALQAIEERYRLAAETASDGIITIDGNSTILFANSSTGRMFGYSVAELLGKDLTILMPEYLRHVHKAGIQRYQQTGKKHITWEGVRLPGLHKDGTEFPVEVSFGEFRKGGQHFFTGIVRDITERERSEKALHESQRTLSTLLANLPGVAYRCVNDFRWTSEFVSEGCREVTGYSPDDFVQRRVYWNDFIHPDDRVTVREQVQQAIAAGRPFQVRYRIRTASGEGKWVSENGRAVPDPAGGPLHLEGFIYDITPQMRAEQNQAALHLISEAAQTAPTLHALLAQIHAIIQQLMPAKNFYVALADSPENVTFPYFVDEEDSEPLTGPFGRGLTAYVLRTGKSALVPPERFEELRRQGEVDEIGPPSIDWLGVPLKLENRVIGVMVVQSYTEGLRYSEEHAHILEFVSSQVAASIERIRAEQAIRQSEERFRALAENSADIVVLIDRNNLIEYPGGSAERVTGYTLEERRGGTAFDLLHPDEIPALKALIAESLQKPGVLLAVPRIQFRHKDGSWRMVEGTVVNQFDLPAVGAIVVTFRDVTERVRLEEQLHQSQKFEAFGQLAGGIAHDFNNHLGAMMGWAELGLAIATDPQGREYFQKIFTQAERAAGLTRQLLAFARRQRLEPRNINLNQSVVEVLGLFEKIIGAHITMKTHLVPDLRVIRADPTQIEQVLTNLFVNARDAMPRGGVLRIQTRNMELDPGACRRVPGSRPGQFVLLEVSDTGEGIDSASLPRIFEPFFTTKAKEKGTGLGLATVYGIVKQHDGFIDVESEPGRGATFRIFLPAVAATVGSELAGGDTALARGGSETLLVVEDNESICKTVCATLQALGYRVLVARDGQVAVELFRQHRSEVSLVLLDIALPGQSGPEAYAQISSLAPGMPVIFSTGYNAESNSLTPMMEKGATVLRKPYSLRLLARKIRELLDFPRRIVRPA